MHVEYQELKLQTKASLSQWYMHVGNLVVWNWCQTGSGVGKIGNLVMCTCS